MGSSAGSTFSQRHLFIRAALLTGGLANLLAAFGLLFTPRWFFETIGHFPPYNRHYAGDAGAFLLPWGLALLIAARQPEKHRTLVGFAALASVLHALNHLIGDWVIERLPPEHLVTDNLPIAALTILLVITYLRLPSVRPTPTLQAPPK